MIRNLEKGTQSLNDAENEVSNDSDAGQYVNKAKEENDKLKQKINDLINNVNTDENINLENLQNLLDSLKERLQDTKNSLLKDKIAKVNAQIKDTKPSDYVAGVAIKYKNEKSKITDGWFESLMNSNSDEKLKDALQKFEAIKSLNDSLVEAQNWILQHNKETKYQEIIDKLSEQVADNMFAYDDTVENSQNKKAEIDKKLAEAKAKVELLSSIDDLKAILGNQNDQQKAIYHDLSNEIKQLEAEYSSYLESNNLTSEQLANKKAELDAKITELKAKKEAIDTQLQNLINDIDANVVNKTDKAIEALKQVSGNENDSFPLYETTKADYEQQKTDPQITLDSLNSFKDKMQKAFAKDKLNNKLNKLAKLTNLDEFDTTNVENPALDAINSVKKGIQSFAEDLKNRLSQDDLNQEDFDKINGQIDKYLDLINTQKKVAKQLKDWLATEDSQQKQNLQNAIQTLSKALQNSQPSIEKDYDDTEAKNSQLQQVYDSLKDQQSNKDENKDAIDNQENGLRQVLQNTLAENASDVDSEAQTKINQQLDELVNKNNGATSDEEIQKIKDFINDLKANKDNVVKLAKEVKNAQDALNATTDTDNSHINRLKDKVKDLIKKAQENYVPQNLDTTTLSKLKDELTKAVKELKDSTELQDLIKQAKLILNGDKTQEGIEFYTYKGLEDKYQKARINQFLDNIQADSLNEDGSQNSAILPQLKARVSATITLLNTLKAISQQINQWKGEQTDKNEVYNIDIEALIDTLWTNSPQPEQRYQDDQDNAKISAKNIAASQKENEIKQLHDHRLANYNLAKEILEKAESNDLANSLPEFSQTIAKRVKTLMALNVSSTDDSVLFSQSNSEAINQQLQVIKDSFDTLKQLATVIKSIENDGSSTKYAFNNDNENIKPFYDEFTNLIASAKNLYNTNDVAKAQEYTKKLAWYQKVANSFLPSYVKSIKKVNGNEQLSDKNLNTKLVEKLTSQWLEAKNISLDASEEDFEHAQSDYEAKNNAVVDLKNALFELDEALIDAQNFLDFEPTRQNQEYIRSKQTKQSIEALKQTVAQASATFHSSDLSLEAVKQAKSDVLDKSNEVAINISHDADKLKETCQALYDYVKAKNNDSTTWNVTIPDGFTYEVLDRLNKAKSTNIHDHSFITTEILDYGIRKLTEFMNDVFNYEQSRMFEKIKLLQAYKDAFSSSKTRDYEGVQDAYDEIVSTLTDLQNISDASLFNVFGYASVDATKSFESDFVDTVEQKISAVQSKINALVSKAKEFFSMLFDNTADSPLEQGLFFRFETTFLGEYASYEMLYAIEPYKMINIENPNLDVYKFLGFNESRRIWVEKIHPAMQEYANLLKQDKLLSGYASATTLAKLMLNTNSTLNDFYDFWETLLKEYSAKYEEIRNYSLLKEAMADIYATKDINSNDANIESIKSSINSIYSNYLDLIHVTRTWRDLVNLFWVSSKIPGTNEFYNSKQLWFITDISKLAQLSTMMRTVNEQDPSDGRLNSYFASLMSKLMKYDYTYGRRYLAISASNTATREQFYQALMKYSKPGDTEIDITENDEILSLFNLFAFTKKDKSSDPSDFNLKNVRVKIVKQDDGSWYKIPNASNSRNISFRLKYEYTPSYLPDYIKVDPVLSIRTWNWYDQRSMESLIKNDSTRFWTSEEASEFPAQNKFGDASVSFVAAGGYAGTDEDKPFTESNNKFGYDSKTPFFDVATSSWDKNLTKDQYEQKISEDIAWAIKNSTNSQALTKVFVDKENNAIWQDASYDNNQSKFDIKFTNPGFINYQNNGHSATYLDLEHQFQIMQMNINKRELTVIQAIPGEFISAPYRNTEADSEFNDLVGLGKAFVPSDETSAYSYVKEYNSPTVTVYYYKFNFEYNEEDKKIYIWNSWMENQTFYKNFTVWSTGKFYAPMFTEHKVTYPGQTSEKTIHTISPVNAAILFSRGDVMQQMGLGTSKSWNYDDAKKDTYIDIRENADHVLTTQDAAGKYNSFKVFKNDMSGKLVWSDPDNPKNTHVTDDPTKKSILYNAGLIKFKTQIQ
ncbi:hypothetical protein ACWXVL_02840 [Mycoplasma sp. 128]